MLRKEKETLEVSNRNMANELLSLYKISDTSKLHWGEIQLPTKMMWRFRVYIPPGKSMQIRYAIGAFTEEFPQPIRQFDEIIEGSDQLPTVTIQIRQKSGRQ